MSRRAVASKMGVRFRLVAAPYMTTTRIVSPSVQRRR